MEKLIFKKLEDLEDRYDILRLKIPKLVSQNITELEYITGLDKNQIVSKMLDFAIVNMEVEQ